MIGNEIRYLLLALGMLFPLQAMVNAIPYQQVVGMTASNISGYGLYYQTQLTPTFYVKGSGLFYIFERSLAEVKESQLNYDVGLEIQNDLVVYPNRRIYALVGGYYFFDKTAEKELEKVNKSKALHSRSVGLGVGVMYDYKRIAVNFDMGYKYYWDTASIKEHGKAAVPEFVQQLKLGGGVSLGYQF